MTLEEIEGSAPCWCGKKCLADLEKDTWICSGCELSEDDCSCG